LKELTFGFSGVFRALSRSFRTSNLAGMKFQAVFQVSRARDHDFVLFALRIARLDPPLSLFASGFAPKNNK
jgi:hypothetical protein